MANPCKINVCGGSSWCATCKIEWDTNDDDPPACPSGGDLRACIAAFESSVRSTVDIAERQYLRRKLLDSMRMRLEFIRDGDRREAERWPEVIQYRIDKIVSRM